MRKPVVGLTGGIASGKSSVAAVFEHAGIPVVDADRIAREVVAKGTRGLASIVSAFGEAVLMDSGELDRKKLGELVFRDADARTRLNAITHPLIAATGMERLASHESGAAPYLVYEAALLVETGGYEGFDALVVIAVSPAVQLARLVERDGCSADEAAARIASQMPLEKKIAVADYVIWNDGSPEAASAEVERVHRELVDRFRARVGPA